MKTVEKANKIVEINSKIIASKREQKILFDEIVNPSTPNKALKNAALNYKKMVYLLA